ncbi:MAG TPA: hypothetical protein VJS44_22095 [Pyrinomonadaceae bacterium]|nr:hypothetical protein [Pyrinomonadaceae bacterium]
MKRKSIKKRICFLTGALLFSFLWMNPISLGMRTVQIGKCEPSVVTYCDLVRNPEKYDSKEVTVRATYRYGFEWQEMFCLECREIGKTWIEFKDIAPDVKAQLRKLPKHQGTINAVFTGTFQSSNGPFGDGGYSFRFIVKAVSRIEVISKDGWTPNKLPLDAQKKICGAPTSNQQLRN